MRRAGLPLVAWALLLLLSRAAAQSAPTTTDNHPKLTTYRCTTAGGCVAQTSALVLEASTHDIRQVAHPELNCGDEDVNATVCPDQATCQQNCAMASIADYSAHGVRTAGADLTLQMLGAGGGGGDDDDDVLSPRVYLLNEAATEYEMLVLTGREFAFEVDMSQLPCGMNSAVYTVEMDATGGQNLTDIPVAGAPYGTGYCDAQCYTFPFANGVGNLDNSGVCCGEVDIWEANSRETHFAPHTCNQTGLYLCDRASGACGDDGVCDKPGCGMNPHRTDAGFYGPGSGAAGVDTARPFSVVTQFPTDDAATTGGALAGYRRLYVQDGRVRVPPPAWTDGAGVAQPLLDDAACAARGADRYLALGGTAGMGAAMTRGMVLVFSLWWDATGGMAWLDGASTGAGPCNASEGFPAFIRAVQPNPTVTFSNIRWGEINSTYGVGYM